jgi:glycosyltransferase involved in cell wall biosynthesis
MKKIAFIHLLNDYSGSPKVLSQIVKNYLNDDIELFTSKDEGFLSGLTKKHRYIFYKRFDNKFLTLFSYVLSQIHLFFEILFSKSEIVYINTLLPFGAALGGKLSGKKVIYHIHETSIKPLALKRFLRIVVSITASKIIFVSNYLATKESFEKIPSFTVYNALENSFLERAKKYSYKFMNEDKFVVMMICSLKDYKGIPEFLKIAKRLELEKHIEFRLILNAEQNEIDEYFKNKEFSNIIIYSKQKDLEKFYSSASLLLNLSRVDKWVETFGLTILEAMAYGVPVIVPPIGGPIEIVEDEKNGYLISSYEIEKISDKILTLSNDEKLCKDLSRNALIKVEDFSDSLFLENIQRVISE